MCRGFLSSEDGLFEVDMMDEQSNAWLQVVGRVSGLGDTRLYAPKIFFSSSQTSASFEESLSQLTHKEPAALLIQLWGKSPEIQRLNPCPIICGKHPALSTSGHRTRNGENDFAQCLRTFASHTAAPSHPLCCTSHRTLFGEGTSMRRYEHVCCSDGCVGGMGT